MKEATTREKILKKVRSALIHKTKNPFPEFDFDLPVYSANYEIPELTFAQKFSEAVGNFIFCENKAEFSELLLKLVQQKKWKKISCDEIELSAFLDKIELTHKSSGELKSVQAVVFSCEALIAGTGSIFISLAASQHQKMLFNVPALIVVASTSQLVNNLKNGFDFINDKHAHSLPPSISILTGSKKVNNREDISVSKELQGSELFLFLVDDSQRP
ncbi:MAG: LUD domain-containing protein [Bacteroidia bacterium]